ncbi:FMN reductase [Spirochaetia bacterium]|nr:FMN reductase [Spirochaetia bacterium]
MDGQNSDKKELLLITGSPRKNGVTAMLAEIFLEEAKRLDKDINVTILDTYTLALNPCTHCGYCKKTPACVHKDFLPVDAALQKADILVIASPVYVLGFPAPLKALLDRSQQYFEAKFSLGITSIKKHKKAILLSAYGSKDNRGILFMEKQLKMIFNVFNAELNAIITARNTDSGNVDFDALREEIKTALAGILLI